MFLTLLLVTFLISVLVSFVVVWKWQVEKGPLWPREKGPPMSCVSCRVVAGRSGARGGHDATSAIVVSPPVACGSLVAGGGLEPVAVADCR